MKKRFESLKRELAPDPAFLDALEAKMTRELRKSQHRKPVRRKSNSIAILFAAAILLVLIVGGVWLTHSRSKPDRVSPAPIVAATALPEPSVTPEPTELTMLEDGEGVVKPSEDAFETQRLYGASYLVGYPSDETIPVRASEDLNSEVIATLISGDSVRIGYGRTESRNDEVWRVQWWDEIEECVRTGWIVNQDTATKHAALLLSPVKYLDLPGVVRESGASLRLGCSMNSPALRSLEGGESIYLIAQYGNWIYASIMPFWSYTAPPYEFNTDMLPTDPAGWIHIGEVYGRTWLYEESLMHATLKADSAPIYDSNGKQLDTLASDAEITCVSFYPTDDNRLHVSVRRNDEDSLFGFSADDLSPLDGYIDQDLLETNCMALEERLALTNVISAALHYNGVEQTIDGEACAALVDRLAQSLPNGQEAVCGAGEAWIELTRANGSTVRLPIAFDSCPFLSYLGIRYSYRTREEEWEAFANDGGASATDILSEYFSDLISK